MKRDWIWLLILLSVFLMGQFFGPSWRYSPDGTELRPPSEDSKPAVLILPDCPADLSNMRFGGACKDLVTGTIKHRGALEAVP